MLSSEGCLSLYGETPTTTWLLRTEMGTCPGLSGKVKATKGEEFHLTLTLSTYNEVCVH